MPRAQSRIAITHCTRYAPVYNQDYNCYVMQGFPNGTPGWITPSVAQREGNHIYMSRSNHFDLCYNDANGFCYSYWWVSATGQSGNLNGSGTIYVYASCDAYVTAYTTGYCSTEWH